MSLGRTRSRYYCIRTSPPVVSLTYLTSLLSSLVTAYGYEQLAETGIQALFPETRAKARHVMSVTLVICFIVK
jgi:hypothetical protein